MKINASLMLIIVSIIAVGLCVTNVVICFQQSLLKRKITQTSRIVHSGQILKKEEAIRLGGGFIKVKDYRERGGYAVCIVCCDENGEFSLQTAAGISGALEYMKQRFSPDIKISISPSYYLNGICYREISMRAE